MRQARFILVGVLLSSVSMWIGIALTDSDGGQADRGTPRVEIGAGIQVDAVGLSRSGCIRPPKAPGGRISQARTAGRFDASPRRAALVRRGIDLARAILRLAAVGRGDRDFPW